MIHHTVNKISAVSFCSSANLSSGFDLAAICTDAFHDRITISVTKDGDQKVTVKTKDLPLDSEKNSASIPASMIMKDHDLRDSITIYIEKGIPIASGLGGSGASAVASVIAMNELFSLDMATSEMARYASLGEKASGSVHVDNVAASLLGNFTIVVNHDPLTLRSYVPSLEFNIYLLIPGIPLKKNTSQLRSILPSEMDLMDQVREKARYSSLVTGLIRGDRDLVSLGMEKSIVETARYKFYTYAEEVYNAGRRRNAIGVSLSGAGPSMILLTDSRTDFHGLSDDIERIMRSHSIPYSMKRTIVSGGSHIEG